jgi:hypothetical protein
MQQDPGDDQLQQFNDEFKLLDVASTDGTAAAPQQDSIVQVSAARAKSSFHDFRALNG